MSDDLTNLTFEKLTEAIGRFIPVLHYATSDAVQRGQMFRYDGGMLYMPYVICHPDDFEQLSLSAALYGWRLEPLAPGQR